MSNGTVNVTVANPPAAAVAGASNQGGADYSGIATCINR